MKKFFGLPSIMLLFLSIITGTAYSDTLLDPTNATTSWRIYSDQSSKAKLDVVNAGKGKAVRLTYEIGNSKWISMYRPASFSLSEMDALTFEYQTTGSTLNLTLKVWDNKNHIYSFHFPMGSSPHSWQTVVIPRKYLSYFSGDGGIDWSALTGIELAIDTGPSFGDYLIDQKSKPSTLSISKIQVIKSDTLKIPGGLIGKSKGEKTTSGKYIIDAMEQASKWGLAADKDAQCTLSNEFIENEKGSKKGVVRAVYDLGIEGRWVSLFRKVKLDLSSMKQLELSIKLSGGQNMLVVKLKDNSGRVYGYKISHSATDEQWQRVVIPVPMFKFYYGGEDSAPINFGDIVQVEIAIERKPDASPAGMIFISDLSYN